MACLSRNNIEAIASCVITDYKKFCDANRHSVRRIDPMILARCLCGLTVDYYHLSNNGSILGLTSQSEIGIEVQGDNGEDLLYVLDGKTILIEKSLRQDWAQRGRHNFTVMHEAAHQILGRLFPQPYYRTSCRIHYCTTDIRQRSTIKDWSEWQADTLASLLLMPEDLVRSTLCQVGLGARVNYLSRESRPKEYERFCTAADFLGASKQALAIRMKQLGLLQHNYRPSKYKAIDVFAEAGETWDIDTDDGEDHMTWKKEKASL